MRMDDKRRRDNGFTLLELLLVVAIVAITGIGATLLTLDTEETVTKKLVPVEMCELKDAILQFKKDTGFLPKCGPFSRNPAVGGRVYVPTHKIDWFDNPANFSQLFFAPKDKEKKTVFPWDIHTGRGWRGPYLQKIDGYVSIGNNLKMDGRGDPTITDTLTPFSVPAAADPFDKEPVIKNPPMQPEQRYFEWKAGSDDDKNIIRGRPYFFFDWNDPDWARLISAGPDGIYQSQDFAARPADPSSIDIGDDKVLFLFR